MRKLFIVNNTIDGISALIVNRLLHKKYTDVIILNQDNYDFKCLNSYKSITCVDVVPFNENKLIELLSASKKIHIFTNNAPEWLLEYIPLKTISINKYIPSSMSYYNSLCYDIPNLKQYLENINDNKYKTIFNRKYYIDYVETIVHRILKNI